MSADFKKTEKQREAISLLSSPARHVMLEGGSRSGKSFILMYATLVRAAKEQSRHVCLRLNFNAIKKSLWMDTLPTVLRICFPGLHHKLNKSDYYCRLSNGSEIWFGGLDDGARTEKILGTEFSTIWFNEVSQIPFSSVQMALSRLAQKNSLKKKVYYDQNPGLKSSWPYWLFHKKLNPTDDEPVNNPNDYTMLRINPADNIDNIDEEYLKLLESMPEAERNRFMLGLYNDQSDGQVYYAFRRDLHVQDTDFYPGTQFLLMDFNVDPMSSIIAQWVDKKLICHEEFWLRNCDTPRAMLEIKKKGYKGLSVIPDSTGRNRKTSGQSDFEIIEKEGHTIMGVHNPFVVDRVNNVNRLLAENRIVINPKCKKLINDLEKVVWKDNKLDQKGQNKLLTHISDALGYGCWYLAPFGMTRKSKTYQL